MATAKKTSKRKLGSRDEILARAAKMRAQVVAFLNRASQAQSTKAIEAGLTDFLKAEKISGISLREALSKLEANGQINGEKQGREHMYWGLKTQLARPAAPAREAAAARVKRTVPLPDGLPNITVDYVKKTGRARVQIGKIVLDVGVVDE